MLYMVDGVGVSNSHSNERGYLNITQDGPTEHAGLRKVF